jgi:hypothetical protein
MAAFDGFFERIIGFVSGVFGEADADREKHSQQDAGFHGVFSQGA